MKPVQPRNRRGALVRFDLHVGAGSDPLGRLVRAARVEARRHVLDVAAELGCACIDVHRFEDGELVIPDCRHVLLMWRAATGRSAPATSGLVAVWPRATAEAA